MQLQNTTMTSSSSIPTLEDLRAASEFKYPSSDEEEEDDEYYECNGEGGSSSGNMNKDRSDNNTNGNGNCSTTNNLSVTVQQNDLLEQQTQTAPSLIENKKKSWFRSYSSTSDRSGSSTKKPMPEPVLTKSDRRYHSNNNNAVITTDNNQQGKAETGSPSPSHKDGHLKESYQQMLKLTMELVDDISLNFRSGDTVLTEYGIGTLLQKQSAQAGEGRDGKENENSMTNVPVSTTTRTHKIQLGWGGTLYCSQSELIHKILSPIEYEQAMDHLEEIRKLQVAIQCHDWGIPPQPDEACVACLFQKPELYSKRKNSSRRRQHTSRRNYSYSWRNKTSSSSTTTSSGNSGVGAGSELRSVTTKTTRCDVCGNPVCSEHKVAVGGGEVEYFNMCTDCSQDLNQTEHKSFHTHHPQLLQTLQRIVQYYTRMSVQLCFCVANLHELGHQLTHKQKRDGAISLGNSALGFVGAALGVAGAAAMLTPAGPAIMLAAVATSATSGTFQGMHASYNKFWSNKAAHQLADRCLGWHGLCLGILNALENLRQDLIVQEHDFATDHPDSASPRKGGNVSSSHTSSISSSRRQHSMEIWNALAVGSFATTRQAMTGVGVTSAMGASYSQAINTGLQGIPVVGAAFSVGCMAMDASNMASSFKMLNTPAKKAVALQGVEQSFARNVVTTITPSVDMIVKGVDDLHERMAAQRQEEERLLIEQELEGLGGDGVYDYEDDDLEQELAEL